MTTTTYNVEIFQPRDPRVAVDDDFEHGTDDAPDLYHDLRDLRTGAVDAEDITFENFGRWYDLVGTEAIGADRTAPTAAVLSRVFETWQNNDGLTDTSDVFREMNDQHRAVSLSAGDIVRVDGTAYLCQPVGWDEVEAVSN